MTRSDTAEVTLRPATDEDREHLLAVYGASRAEELDQVEWAPGSASAFLGMQFDAQDTRVPPGQPRAVLRRDRRRRSTRRAAATSTDAPATCASSTSRCCRRSAVAGSARGLIAELQQAAAAEGRIVSIHVEVHNPAARLYERLGFVVADDLGVYRRMEWTP